MNDLTVWLIAKMLNFFKNHEGVVVEDNIKSADSVRAIIRDSLGFRYEIQLKCIGRIQDDKRN